LVAVAEKFEGEEYTYELDYGRLLLLMLLSLLMVEVDEG